jgi:hypothetical protein
VYEEQKRNFLFEENNKKNEIILPLNEKKREISWINYWNRSNKRDIKKK